MNRVLVLIISTTLILGCKQTIKEKNKPDLSANRIEKISDLSENRIEKVFRDNPEDTLLVLGHFIASEKYDYTSYTILASEILGKSFNNLDISDLETVRTDIRKLFKEKRGTAVSQIAIQPTFKPEIKITDALSKTSLRTLIVNDISIKNVAAKWKKEFGNASYYEESWGALSFDLLKEYYPTFNKSVIYIGDNTNLSKVFYLQDKQSFIELNEFYYYGIRGAYMYNLLKEIESESQSNWNEYL